MDNKARSTAKKQNSRSLVYSKSIFLLKRTRVVSVVVDRRAESWVLLEERTVGVPLLNEGVVSKGFWAIVESVAVVERAFGHIISDFFVSTKESYVSDTEVVVRIFRSSWAFSCLPSCWVGIENGEGNVTVFHVDSDLPSSLIPLLRRYVAIRDESFVESIHVYSQRLGLFVVGQSKLGKDRGSVATT